MVEKFKPCPFCGNKKIKLEKVNYAPLEYEPIHDWHYCGFCHECLAHGPIGCSEGLARAAWNGNIPRKEMKSDD